MKELLIKIKAAFEGKSSVDEATASFASMRSRLEECMRTGSLFGSAMGSLVSAGITGGIGLLIGGLDKLKDALVESAKEGMRFHRIMQDSQIAIAGGFRSVDPNLSFSEAKQKGGEALDSLKQKAVDLGINFEALIDTFKVNIPIMWQAGIRDTQKMIDMIVLLNQVAAAKGIDGFQAQRDIIDIMNGMGQRTILGKELEANGVTNEAIQRAKEQGTLYDLITSKLAAYGEAGKAASETQTASIERLKTSWGSLLGDLSKPFAQTVTDGINAISEALRNLSGTAKNASGGVADFFGGLGVAVKSLSGITIPPWLQKYLDYQTFTARASGKAGVKVAEGIGTLLTGAGEANRLLDAATAQDAESDKIQADNFAKKKKLLLQGRDLPGSPSGDIAEFSGLRTADALAAAEAKGDQSPAEKLKDLKKQLSDTEAWTRTPGNDTESGLKKALELSKQIAEVQKKIKEESDKATKEDATNKGKREELDLETRIAEAKASGNTALVEKLNWQKEYSRLLKEAQDAKDPNAYADAIRGANAAGASPSTALADARSIVDQALQAVPMSELASRGLAMGETATSSAVVTHLQTLIAESKKSTEDLGKIEQHTAEMSKRRGGWQP